MFKDINFEFNERNLKWNSFEGISIILIFLNGIFPPEIILALQVFLMVFLFNKIRLPKGIFFIISLILLQGILSMLLGTDTVGDFLKQFIGILISLTYWFTITYNFSINKLLYLYKNASVFTSIVSIFQFLAGSFGFSSLSNMGWLIKSQISTTGGRSAAFFSEPSECAIILFPMAFIALYSIIGKRKKVLKRFINLKETFIILLGYFCTMSTVGYIGIFICLLTILFEYRMNLKQILIVVIAFFMFSLLYNNVTFFQQRINDTYSNLYNSNDLAQSNLSTQTLILNKDIAIKSFEMTKGLGGGLGSHEISYNKYIGDFDTEHISLFLNKDDANSLFLRIISELGILGMFLIGFFLIKFRVANEKDNAIDVNRIIYLMIVSYIFIRMIRFGHYFNCGFFMFISLYYLNNRAYKIKIKDVLCQ